MKSNIIYGTERSNCPNCLSELSLIIYRKHRKDQIFHALCEVCQYFCDNIQYDLDVNGMTYEEYKNYNSFGYHDFFQDFIEHTQNQLNNDKDGSKSYLNNRCVFEDQIDKYRIGYVPKNKSFFDNFYKKYPNVIDRLKYRNNAEYCLFSGNIVFPITSFHTGNVVGFASRNINKKIYIHSPNCLLYRRSKILIGAYENWDLIVKKKKIVFVEGIFDLLAYEKLFQSIAVSTLTCKIPSKHFPLKKMIIDRTIKSIDVFFDHDNAGDEGALKFIDEYGDRIKITRKYYEKEDLSETWQTKSRKADSKE